MEDLLYCCSFSDASGDTGITAELLSAMGWDFSSRLDAESGETWQTLYFSTKPEAEEAKTKLEELRPIWKELDIVFGDVAVTELKKENWAESWKIHFKPMEISERLAITPPWVDFPAKPGQKVIILNPGLSFGTGQHATTKFCLSKLDEIAQSLPENSSMLDAGCGSGILAIAGALLDYGPIDAFDFDPEAVEVSKENAELNQVEKLISFEVGDAAVWQGRAEKYDLVCANILGHLLIAFRFNIVSWVAPGGLLVLSGILDRDFDKVSAAFCEVGMKEVERFRDKDWTSGVFGF